MLRTDVSLRPTGHGGLHGLVWRSAVHVGRAIPAADPGIQEGVAWNAPSFRTGGHFATMNLRKQAGFGVILHVGAKVRAIVGFAKAADDDAREAASAAPIRAWVRHA